MPMEKIQRKIRNRKFLLNLSLKYFNPSNKLHHYYFSESR